MYNKWSTNVDARNNLLRASTFLKKIWAISLKKTKFTSLCKIRCLIFSNV